MLKAIQVTLSIVIIFIYANQSIAQNQKSTPKKISNQLIVQMQSEQNAHEISREIDPNYELKVVKVLSQHSDIWLVEFNENNVDKAQILNELNRLNTVLYAQPNRAVELRAAPNDPDFGNQWQYNNIEAQDAWDITTGGTTPNGTEIVVALIESADLINHEDLKDNQWVNTAEIPNNGIDDDGNGYIDDYNGWNVGSDNDDIGTGSHGTSCAGMIGAKGNNGKGVTGMNWDVKIMDIAGYNNPFTEANIIEAYNYALQARLLWNQTQGAEGAFVVATSASWGVDNGDPDDYPIWCNFYDDLGAAGILNCGATTNNNNDVDVVGDVPTACASDYMISVTATDQSDIIDFAGYGQTTIDVGSPGSNIYTTSPNDNYGSTSGTSFATPLTAGLIGLMYSVPCENLEASAKANPQNTADIVRQALFDGVDKSGYLATRTVTGGRINAKKAIDTLMSKICNSCTPISNIATDSVGDEFSTIHYNKLDDTSNYKIYLRLADTGNWINYSTPDTTFTFSGLANCTRYEYAVSADCSDDSPESLALHSFTTSGCGNCIDFNYCDSKAENPGTTFFVSAPSSIEGTYSFAPTGNFGGNLNSGYTYGELVLVDDGSSTPEEGCNTLTNVLEVNNNIAVIMRGTCPFTDKVMNAQDAGATAAIIINNVSSAPFEMGGTNSSITIPAVMISQSDGNTLLSSINNGDHPMALLGQQNEWIASFEIDGNNFITGDNDGYIFTSEPLTLTIGTAYPFSIEPGFDGAPLEEYYRIWIDLDQDGNFSQSELIYDAGNTTGSIINDNLTIPLSATLGSTRMRVQMAFQGFNNTTLPNYCGNFFSGEVEDYCVTLNDEDLGLGKNKFEDEIIIYPNPSKGQIFIEKSANTSEVKIYNPKGQLINKMNLTQAVTTIDAKNWSSGIYFVHIFDKEGGIISIQKVSIVP